MEFMAFRNGCYASIWEIKPAESGKYTDVKISVSTRKQNTQNYVQDFSGTVRFIGDANAMIQKYVGRVVGEDRRPITRLKLDEVAVTTSQIERRDGGGKMWYTSFQCYACSEPDTTQAKPQFNPSIPNDVTDEELPFS